jgi:small subunit ribosomal protein S9
MRLKSHKNTSFRRKLEFNSATRTPVLGGNLSLIQYYGTGKRKTSVARVFLRPGKGDITLHVNKRPRQFTEYFYMDGQKHIIKQPLRLTETENKFDIFIRVNGGGLTGQAEAIRLILRGQAY